MQLSENARRVLDARYLRRDAEGTICETPEQLFARVAWAISRAELLLGNQGEAARWEDDFYCLLTNRDFLCCHTNRAILARSTCLGSNRKSRTGQAFATSASVGANIRSPPDGSLCSRPPYWQHVQSRCSRSR
jgi:hypothetical protein